MKKYKIFVNITLYIILFSCIDGGDRSYDKYELKNTSSCLIRVEVFEMIGQSYVQTIVLTDVGDIWESELIDTSEPSGSIHPPSFALGGDSVIVHFNEEKSINLVFPFDNEVNPNLNILDYDSYDVEKLESGDRVLTFRFTDEVCDAAYLID
jgi:hypothetical protein